MKSRIWTIVSAATAPLVVVFGVVPLGLLLVRAIDAPAGTLDGASIDALAGTLVTATGATLFAVVLGGALALLIACTDLPGRGALRSALSLPLVVPPYVYAMAWIALANPSSGLLQPLAGGALDVYGRTGLVLVLGTCELPLVLLPALSAFSSVDASLFEAARISGSSARRAAWDVLVPLALPAIGGGAALVFASSAAAFGVPYLLGTGGHSGAEVLTTSIVGALDVGTDASRARGALLSILLVGSVLPALVAGGWLARSGRVLVSGKAGRPCSFSLGRARAPLGLACGAFTAVAVVIPLGTIALTSVLRTFGEGIGPDNWTLQNYFAVLGRGNVAAAVGRSVLYAAAAAAICTILGGAIASARDRGRSLVARVVASAAELPYAIPGTAIAVGLLLAFSREIRVIVLDAITVSLALAGTGALLVVAYAVKGLAIGIRNAAAGLARLDPSLVEAARISGSGPWGAEARITFPLLAPARHAAFTLVLLPAFGEITMSILLFSPDTETLGVTLFDLQSYADPPAAAVLATLLLCATVVVTTTLGLLSRRRA